MSDSDFDWIAAYAEARAAFPGDVWLHTEDDPRGGVQITAYRTEFVPPLPEHLRGTIDPTRVEPAQQPYVTEDERGHQMLHRAETFRLTFVVREGESAAYVAGRAARRWERDAALRRVTAGMERVRQRLRAVGEAASRANVSSLAFSELRGQ